MAILAVVNEGSEESRQKRAVRRYLNKKKDQRPERQDESVVQVDESVVVGSIPHMEHAVHNRHVHGIEAPDYHIHNLGFRTNIDGHHTHTYVVIHKRPLANDIGDVHHPLHHFEVDNTAPHTIVHMGRKL